MGEQVEVGVIGGSGVYEIEGVTDVDQIDVSTPYGSPSDSIVTGTLGGKRVAFLPRHGRGHTISPSDLNAHANIYALKSLGAQWVVSVSAVGSLREDIAPRDFIVPHQIIDYTKTRSSTFFDDGIVVHVSMADPFCDELRGLLADAAERAGANLHRDGTYICMEGPQFSSRGESELYRQWGMDIIGMTAMPEAKLAREAELCYAMLACSTDYDCWHPDHNAVTIDMLIDNLHANSELAKKTIVELLPTLPADRGCDCDNALATAIVTQQEAITDEVKQRYNLLLGKYL